MQTIAHDESIGGAETSARTPSRRRLGAGRTLGGIAAAFLLLDAAAKLLELPPVVDGALRLGYPRDTVFPMGVILLGCVMAYLVPRTSVLGAVLLTGYLGGAVATHVRVASPLLSHVLFPTYVAALVWGGLVLREPRLLVLVPLRREA